MKIKIGHFNVELEIELEISGNFYKQTFHDPEELVEYDIIEVRDELNCIVYNDDIYALPTNFQDYTNCLDDLPNGEEIWEYLESVSGDLEIWEEIENCCVEEIL